jgi:hypothetical protein
LDLDRPSLKAGDIGEWTIGILSKTQNSSTSGEKEVTTNKVTHSELNGKERVLKWDLEGDFSTTDLEVKYLVSGDDFHTNELLKPGTHVIGTSMAGENFFQPQNGRLTEAAYQLLRQIYLIRPRDFDSFPKPRLPQNMAEGECLKLTSPLMMSNCFAGFGINLTNGLDGTACLIGTTNLFGLDCFHLQVRVTATNTPFNPYAIVAANLSAHKDLIPEYYSQTALVLDFIEPFDSAQKSFFRSMTMEWSDRAEMPTNGTAWRYQGHLTTQIFSEYHYLGHQP